MTPTPNKKNKRMLAGIFIFLVILFVVLQLYTLSSVGTKGEKVSELKRKQSEVKIENEIKRAKILELQSNMSVLNNLTTKITLEEKNIISIDTNNSDLSEIAAFG